MVPLCSVCNNDKHDGVPVTYPWPRIQCFLRVGRIIYPWVAMPYVTETLLPVHKVPLIMSLTIDLPLLRGRLRCPRALVYGNGSLSRVSLILCGEGMDTNRNIGVGVAVVY